MYDSTKRSSARHRVVNVPGGSGRRTATAPSSLGSQGSPLSRRMRTSKPGTGRVGDPGFTGSGSIPMQFAAIGQPLSVCHQWSMTGTPSRREAQW